MSEIVSHQCTPDGTEQQVLLTAADRPVMLPAVPGGPVGVRWEHAPAPRPSLGPMTLAVDLARRRGGRRR